VVRLTPDDKTVHRKLATLLLMNGHDDEAERECQRCLETESADLELTHMLATIYHHQGRAEAAAGLAERILRGWPEYPPALLLRGELYLETKQPEAALPFLRKAAAAQGPSQLEALYQLSVGLAWLGQEKEAQRVIAEMEWRQALDVWSRTRDRTSNLVLQTRVVDALVAAGRAQDAIHFLDKILRESPQEIVPHQLLASLYEKEGQPGRAAEHRRRAGLTP
jgi:predicted Zn-dependent protease